MNRRINKQPIRLLITMSAACYARAAVEGGRTSSSSLIVSSGVERAFEDDAAPGKSRPPFGNDTLRLGGVRFSGCDTMLGGIHDSVKDSPALCVSLISRVPCLRG